jgi:HD superfamily phosphodiesterase
MPSPADASVSILPAQALALKRWFFRYTARKIRRHPSHKAAMVLKLAHSIRVSRICALIGADLGLEDSRLHLARTVGLLHDVARFDQLIRFGTFVDRVSVDHGALGADILSATSSVGALPSRDCDLLIHAVRHHNAATVPETDDPDRAFYLKLVRDADKLDIFRLLTEIWLSPGGEEPASEALQLQDLPEVSAPIKAAIEANRIAPMAAVRTRADLLLVRLAWVFDLHFDPTVIRLARQGSVAALAQTLPESPSIRSLVNRVQTHMAERLAATVYC